MKFLSSKLNNNNMAKVKIGENTKVLIDNMKTLIGAGELVQVENTHQIDMDFLSEVCLKKSDLDMEEEKKHMKKIENKISSIESICGIERT